MTTDYRADEPKLKSYVWHDEKCYFVSTIERDSSAAYYPMRYFETLVWEYDWQTTERGEIVGHYGNGDAFRQHMKACEDFYRNGKQGDE